MHETPEDIERLDALIRESHADGGSHLRSIFDETRRMDARQVADEMRGVQVLNLATVTSKCLPRVAPVDGLFYRGNWYFGSSPDSLRFRHLAKRAQVSAAHTRAEELAVIVHGTAQVIDLAAEEARGFREYLLEVYVPLYGGDFGSFADDAKYARIDAERMFTFRNRPR